MPSKQRGMQQYRIYYYNSHSSKTEKCLLQIISQSTSNTLRNQDM